MALTNFLRELLATILAATLLTGTVPPPIRITRPPVRPYRANASSRIYSNGGRTVTSHSTTFQVTPQLRSIAESSGTAKGSPSQAPANKQRSSKIENANRLSERPDLKHLAALEYHGLKFIENKGQFDPRVKFQGSNGGKTLWLTQNRIVFDFVKTERNQTRALPSNIQHPNQDYAASAIAGNAKIQNAIGQIASRDVIYQDFVGAGDKAVIETKGVQEGIRNYFSGSDPKKWQTDVRGYSEIVYHDVWKGVDLRLYGNGPNLEQEFTVAPGANFSQVQIKYEGIEGLKIEKDGSLLIKTAAGHMRESAPRIYQDIAGRRVAVKGQFKLLSPTSYTFAIAKHDARQALVIDPPK